MATTSDLYILLTRGYNSDYQHLENQEFVGTITYGSDPTRPDKDNEYDDDDEANEAWDDTAIRYYVARVEPVSPKIRVSVIKKAIEDHFRVGCSCTHDCCGCWFGGVRKVKYLGDGHLYLITTAYQRNF